MDLDIKDNIALVTGGAGSIGSATVRLLLHDGVTVVLANLDENAQDETVRKLNVREGRLFAFAPDVTDVNAVARL